MSLLLINSKRKKIFVRISGVWNETFCRFFSCGALHKFSHITFCRLSMCVMLMLFVLFNAKISLTLLFDASRSVRYYYVAAICYAIKMFFGSRRFDYKVVCDVCVCVCYVYSLHDESTVIWSSSLVVTLSGIFKLMLTTTKATKSVHMPIRLQNTVQTRTSSVVNNCLKKSRIVNYAAS